MPWQLAVSQHPMYFLIREDAVCAERTPPWGAPDIGTYIERLRANTTTLREQPQLKLGFEWSALELEQLAHDAPGVLADMLALAGAGRLAFYNGTYAQPHLQTLSAEANYRQFEYGARVYRRLGAPPVTVYAHQETSFNEQTPQLLRAFGYQQAVLPHFVATLILDGGELSFHAREGLLFVHGSEFAAWRGLDGTTIDTYLRQPKHGRLREWVDNQEVKGLLHVPPVIIESPDLVALDAAWLAERAPLEFVLLDQALPARLHSAPPRARMRLFANWSYVEGIRAEELSRANWRAEHAALHAEALGALTFALLGRPPEPTDGLWQTILTTQHHDVYCFCAPDLKRKAIGWLQAATRDAEAMTHRATRAMLAQIRPLDPGREQVVIFNPLPHPVSAPVSVEVASAAARVIDAEGQPLPCEAQSLSPGRVRLTFVAHSRGLGYASYRLGEGPETAEAEIELTMPVAFENQHYLAVLEADGTFSSLRTPPNGRELLTAGALRGNQLAACDSTGLGTTHTGVDDVSQPRVRRLPAARGPALAWEATTPTRLRRGPLGLTLTATGRLGPRVQAKTVIRLYHALPWLEITWTFDFDEASLGSFFDDETKLRVQWPLAAHAALRHDIAFGDVASFEDRPFFPASWVDLGDDQHGLAYFHQGTPKHWVTDGVLNNLLAWGEETDAIGNRLDMGRWPKTFDQRLRGTHTIRMGMYPHAGNWRVANVIGVARSFAQPLLACTQTGTGGALPAHHQVLAFTGEAVAATAIMVEGDHLLCRCYSTGPQAEVTPAVNGVAPAGLFALTGEAITALSPYQIGTLRLAPNHAPAML